MVRCFPAEPEFAEDRRAERVVWEALRDQLPDDAALFHSVGLLDGAREQEIDLLVGWPGVGIAVVEVKGGLVSRDGQGWHQASGGRRWRIDSPVTQAQDGRHVLTRYLQRRAPDAAVSRIVHLAALPYTAVPPTWDAPDCPRGLLVGSGDMADVAGRVRAAVERHGGGHQPLSRPALEALVETLAAAMPEQTSPLALAEEHEQRLDQMTRDQAGILRQFRYYRRLKVIGGAGTGKTWLALEQARRLSDSGERVALLCYSRGLGRYLERITAGWPPAQRPAYAGLFHQLAVDWGAEAGNDDDSDYWERRLPLRLGELAAQRRAEDRFDSVVVDEAQDFGELWWPSLLGCLRDPDTGGLFVFLDESQRVFARLGEVPIALPPVVLDENVRNTRRIAELFSSLSGEPLRLRGLEGPPVRLVEARVDDVVPIADDAVVALLDEGWRPGQLALLTTLNRHPEQRSAVGLGGWAAYWDDFFAERDVFYGHVLGFKGLERPVVVLAVNGFRDPARAREMLYVGLSRARTLLVVVGPAALLVSVGGEDVRRRLEAASAWSTDTGDH